MKLIVVLLLCVTCLVDCHTKKMRKRKWMDYHRNNLSNGQLTTKNNGDASSTTKISRNGILTRNTNKPQNKRKLITPRGNRDHNMKLRPTRAANRRSKTNIPRRKSKNKNCNNNNKRKSKRTTSERIRENYNEARWIQKPMLYAFSTTEAEKFVSRFDEDLAVPVTSQCTNQKTKVSKKDIRDLGRILKTAQCSSTKDKDNSRRRKRRATLGPQTVVNPDGSITRIRKCVNRGVVTEKGYIRLCSQCHAVTELPNQMYVLIISVPYKSLEKNKK